VYGLEAINAHNGFAMAIAGALIVMTGLSVLSFVISRLHRILALLENKKSEPEKEASPDHQAPAAPAQDPEHDLSRLSDSVPLYRSITTELGDGFNLQDLFTVFQTRDFPHPHLTIRSLKEEGYLVPSGEGLFSWKA